MRFSNIKYLPLTTTLAENQLSNSLDQLSHELSANNLCCQTITIIMQDTGKNTQRFSFSFARPTNDFANLSNLLLGFISKHLQLAPAQQFCLQISQLSSQNTLAKAS